MKKYICLILVSAITVLGYADTFSVADNERLQMQNESEDWMDNIPDGLQDRLSDAISHAEQGFFSEIKYFRSLADTVGAGNYPVGILDVKGGKGGNIPMQVYKSTKSAGTKLPVLIYFHGGGWSLGSVKSVDKFCRALASLGNLIIVSVEYPLAPENPYPAALDTCEEAVEYVFQNASGWGGDPAKISLGGDGAGGNLALVLSQRLSGEFSIRSLVLYYPLVKTSGKPDPGLKREFGRGYGFDSRLRDAFIEAYNDTSDQNFGELPPTLLISAGQDIIVQEGKELSQKSSDISIVVFEGALHGFVSDGHQPTAFNKAVVLTDQFIR